MKKDRIKQAVYKSNIEWRKHALQRMLERNISRDDVKSIILDGEIIESYDEDKPFPSMLFFKKIVDRAIHVVISFDEKMSAGCLRQKDVCCYSL